MSVPTARLFARGTPLRYAAGGLVNTGAGYAVMLGLGALGMAAVPANAAGFAAGFLVSLGVARYTFGPAQRTAAPLRYAAAFAACYGVNLAMVLAALGAGLPAQIAQGGGVGAYAVSFYLACRWWVFGGEGAMTRDLAMVRAWRQGVAA